MKGYITIVRRDRDDGYQAEILGVPGCKCTAPTVDEALHAANQTLRRTAEELQERGVDLPEPRPSHHLISESAKHAAIAGACLREPKLSA
ncbi:MAG: hypothetical protein LDL26_01790 [Caenispirillum bisanense]|nr:hypothetical protein [Caenispirillum bisanense]MCA1971705.1 hypothetical protein [Caenispirillum sp.]